MTEQGAASFATAAAPQAEHPREDGSTKTMRREGPWRRSGLRSSASSSGKHKPSRQHTKKKKKIASASASSPTMCRRDDHRHSGLLHSTPVLLSPSSSFHNSVSSLIHLLTHDILTSWPTKSNPPTLSVDPLPSLRLVSRQPQRESVAMVAHMDWRRLSSRSSPVTGVEVQPEQARLSGRVQCCTPRHRKHWGRTNSPSVASLHAWRGSLVTPWLDF